MIPRGLNKIDGYRQKNKLSVRKTIKFPLWKSCHKRRSEVVKTFSSVPHAFSNNFKSMVCLNPEIDLVQGQIQKKKVIKLNDQIH